MSAQCRFAGVYFRVLDRFLLLLISPKMPAHAGAQMENTKLEAFSASSLALCAAEFIGIAKDVYRWVHMDG